MTAVKQRDLLLLFQRAEIYPIHVAQGCFCVRECFCEKLFSVSAEALRCQLEADKAETRMCRQIAKLIILEQFLWALPSAVQE